MGSNFKNLTVTWFDETDGYATSANVPVTDLIKLPIFTDTGSGEVNEAEIELSAKGGNWVNTGNVVDKYDRFRITLDDLSGNTYDRYYEVENIVPSQNKTEGSIVTFQCLGIEYHTQMIHYARQHFFSNAFLVAKDIGTVYEANNGVRQPLISAHDSAYSTSTKKGNAFPEFTNNHYEFGRSEDTCYNYWMAMKDALGSSVEQGGFGDFFEIGFDTPAVNQIDFAGFISGARSIDGTDANNDGSLTTIKNTTSINVSEQEGGISNPTGTNVLAWGSQEHGSLPIGLSRYRGEELEFLFRPKWVSGIEYKQNAKIVYTDGAHYKADSDHTSSSTNAPDGASPEWTQIDMSTEFGDSVQYSPWTDDKAGLWLNSGVDPSSTTALPAWQTSTSYTKYDLVTNGGNEYRALEDHTSDATSFSNDASKWEQVDNALLGNGCAFFDSNIVIRDDGESFFRTWVNEVVGDTDYSGSTDATLNANYQYDTAFGAINLPPEHRILNISNTFLSGTDLNGKSFGDAIIRRTLDNNTTSPSTAWEVMINPSSTTDRIQVVSLRDRQVWEWDNSASQWKDVTSAGGFRNDDCFHEFFSIQNISGTDPKPEETDNTTFPDITSDGSTFSTNIRSAVEVVYKFTSGLGALATGVDDYKKGAWLNFAFPFPISKYNSIGEGVGDLYGGGDNENSGLTYPWVLDIQNMSATHNNKFGFNHGTDSEDLGPIQSVSFMMRVLLEDAAQNAMGGVLNVRCTMVDTKDNVVTQDFELDVFKNEDSWHPIDLPISGFQIYRGRTPLTRIERALSIANFRIPLNELDVHDVFEFRNIKLISFQIQDFYNEDGRYNPEKELFDFDATGSQIEGGGVFRMAIDAFHFKKPLLVTSGQDTTQNLEPTFLQHPEVISYKQLKHLVFSEKEIQTNPIKEYNFQTSGDDIFDIRFGDSIFLQNSDLISDTDDTSTGETTKKKIKLVVKRIEYHLTKTRNGPGGLTRTIKGVKRFNV